MALYAPNKPGHTEAAITQRTPSGDAGTDTITNDGVTMLRFTNSGAQHICTVEATENCSQGYTHDITVTIPATTGDVWIGPFPQDRFNDSATNAYLTITWGASVTGVNFYALSAGGTVTGG